MLRQVKIENGLLQGIPGGDPRITVFKGVPYAKPPVGELRWKNAQPLDNWDGVKVADKFAPVPMMYDGPGVNKADFYTKELNPTATEYEMSEDCLYLNVWTPAETADEKLPVFFYIHGGGHTAGYSYEMEFDGERVARKGVIMVSIGYRLGLFGFFAHPELTAEDPDAPKGNYGLTDQLFALKWVKRNIAAFGGDPDKITIAGQSAGAASVQSLITSPMAEGLIQGAIVQSSISPSFKDISMSRCKTLEDAEKDGVALLKEIGISSIAEARNTDAFELINRILKLHPLKGVRAWTVIDNVYLHEDAGSAYLNNHYHNIPIIYGHNFGEAMRGFFRMGPNGPKTLAEFDEFAKVYGEHADEFKALANVKTDEDVVKLFEGDDFNTMFAGAKLFGHIASSQGRRVYTYLFDAPIPGEDNAGSYHGSEMWFTFDSLNRCWRPFTGLHYDLARKINGYWINFIKTGDPNGKTWIGEDLPEWKPFTSDDEFIMGFKENPFRWERPTDDLLKFRIDFTMGNLK